MHHLPHDWSGPDDGHFHDNVVETLWGRSRGSVAICARVGIMEYSDRVRFLQHARHRRIVRGQVREIEYTRPFDAAQGRP